MYPGDYRYHRGHEWVGRRGERWVIGVTDFAQRELEAVVYVELPAVGVSFAAEDVIGSVESIKAIVDLYTPVGGRVADRNLELLRRPGLLNDDPHGRGWLIELEAVPAEDLQRLLSAEQYREMLGAKL